MENVAAKTAGQMIHTQTRVENVARATACSERIVAEQARGERLSVRVVAGERGAVPCIRSEVYDRIRSCHAARVQVDHAAAHNIQRVGPRPIERDAAET